MALAAGLVALSLALDGCGGSDDGGQAPATQRVSINENLFHQAQYDVETSWGQEASDKKVGHYLESVWYDPGSFSSKLVIDSRSSNNTAPPLAAAELARAQTNRMPEYHERSFGKVEVGGHPAIRWTYDVGGEGYVSYFFAECGISIFFHGSTSPIAFEPFAEAYHYVASKTKVFCGE